MRQKTRKAGLSRRQFLGLSTSGLLGFSSQPLLRSAQAPGGTPASALRYDISNLRHVDPSLIHYQAVRQWLVPGEDARQLVVNHQDRLFVAVNKAILILDQAGNRLDLVSFQSSPTCVAVEGDLLYAGFRDHIEIVDQKRQSRTNWERVPDRCFFTGLALSKDDLFVADAGRRVIRRYDRTGKLRLLIGERNPERNIPGIIVPSPFLDVEVASDGLLRVNNPGRHRVEAYTTSGDFEFAWGKPSGAIEGFCGCCNPIHISLLPDGRCVTFEKGLPRVKMYRPDGTMESVVAGPSQFSDPSQKPFDEAAAFYQGALDGAIDSQGRIYVLEMSTRAVVHVFEKRPNRVSANQTSGS